MTDHILNFAISIDDDAIIKNIQKNAEKQIINQLTESMANHIFESKYYGTDVTKKDPYNGKTIINDKDIVLKERFVLLIKDFFEEYKDVIIEKASDKLANSYSKTKSFKEIVSQKMEN